MDQRSESEAAPAPAKIGASGRAIRLAAGLLLLAGAGAYVASEVSGHAQALVIVIAGVVGAYMAMNIGANDVANNVGPAVGSGALTMVGALALAAVFEAAGAAIAGGDVIGTISKGIIDPASIPGTGDFVRLMLAALFAAAVWINFATLVGAPVSTTHSIVGGVLGAGVAAAGVAAVDWGVMGMIAASWVISPVLGGVVAAAFLTFIKWAIVFRDDKIAAAKTWVPILVAIMGAAFSGYLIIKGVKQVWRADTPTILAVSVTAFATIYVIVKPMVAAAAETMRNTREDVGRLFTIPLIVAAAFLCFAHGSNDVANAIGPLAAIVHGANEGGIAAKVAIPHWVILVGALGISAGLSLFGGRMVKRVGKEITDLDRLRAFSVALSSAITVIVASAFALPVSSTHIALGAIFGIGFLREYLENEAQKVRIVREFFSDATEPSLFDTARGEIEWRHKVLDRALRDLLPERQRLYYFELTQKAEAAVMSWQRKKLVRRSHVKTIVMAWLVTVPATALIAGLLYFAATAILAPTGGI